MQKTINGADFRKMIMLGAGLLEQNKKVVDALNVFPVPDGDTGTNMFLTLKSAVSEVNKITENDLPALSEALSKGALRGARGNSGVITSQILKGFCSVIGQSKEITTKQFAKALSEELFSGEDEGPERSSPFGPSNIVSMKNTALSRVNSYAVSLRKDLSSE